MRLTASLYGPDRNKPLYAGALETGYDIEHSGWTAVPAGPIAMQTQSDLLAEPARMAQALRDALAGMAQATTRDLLGARAATAAGAPVPVAGVPPPVSPGDYAGSLRCGAYDGPDQVPSPAPWVAPVRVSVTGAQASMRRGDAKYSESLAGRVDGSGMTLEGRGGMVATPQLYWTTRLWGGFSPDGSRFDGQAHLIDMRGRAPMKGAMSFS